MLKTVVLLNIFFGNHDKYKMFKKSATFKSILKVTLTLWRLCIIYIYFDFYYILYIYKYEFTCILLVYLQENGRRQKSNVCEKFDHLYAILEDRKREMNLKVNDVQEEKLNYIRGLTRKYGDHLEAMTKIMETGTQTLEEPEMAVFLQVI